MENNSELNNEDKERQLTYYFKKIEEYFKEKENFILSYKHIPIEEIFKKAPKYYSVISLIEKINIFLSKDKQWLKHFTEKNSLKFDNDDYERWKAGKKFSNFHYTDTQSPSKWVHVLQDFLIELLEYLQILLVMEFYINDKDYKEFLQGNPKIFFKIKANFKKPSPPSEDLDKIFEAIDFLLNINIANNFPTNHVVDTALCIKVYKKIDKMQIIDLLKRKEFYIKFRLLYLKMTNSFNKIEMPFKDNIIKVGDDFLKTVSDFFYSHNEYKTRLIQKQQHFLKYNK